MQAVTLDFRLQIRFRGYMLDYLKQLLIFKPTYKLLFVDPNNTKIDSLISSLKGKPIGIVFQLGIGQSYLIDTGLRVIVTQKRGKHE